jgi:paraquat-inducible protein A
MKTSSLIACHECDLLHRLQPLPDGGVAKCRRCGAVLHRNKPNSLDRTLALTFAGLILFILCNTFPFLALKSGGLVQETTLITGIRELYAQGKGLLALLVLLTSILVPFVQITGMLYVLVPLKFSWLPWKLAPVFRLIRGLQPWGMMEVFMLGILVSVVKLAKLASIVPGVALFAFMALIFVLAGAVATLDPHLVWEKLGESV